MTRNRHSSRTVSDTGTETAQAHEKRHSSEQSAAQHPAPKAPRSAFASSDAIIEPSDELVSAAEVRRVVETAIRELAAALDRLPDRLGVRFRLSPDDVDVSRELIADMRRKVVSDLTVLLKPGDDDPLG